MTRLGDLFLIPEWTVDEREAAARLLSRIESIALDLGSRIDAQGKMTELRAGSVTLSASGVTVTIGGNELLKMAEDGITLINDDTQSSRIWFWGAAGTTRDMSIFANNGILWIVNHVAGQPININAAATSASYSMVWHEDSALANRMQLDLGVGTAGTKLTIGGEVEIHGGADSVTTVFNEASRDIDFRVEGATVDNVFVVDAGKDVAYFRGIGARVYNSANISTDDDVQTFLTFDSERFDTDTIHSTASNTGRLTATTAGTYMIAANVMFASNATGIRRLEISLNAARTLIARDSRQAPTQAVNMSIGLSCIYQLAAGDYVECAVEQISGGALNILAEGNNSPEFMMQRVG